MHVHIKHGHGQIVGKHVAWSIATIQLSICVGKLHMYVKMTNT